MGRSLHDRTLCSTSDVVRVVTAWVPTLIGNADATDAVTADWAYPACGPHGHCRGRRVGRLVM